MSQYLLLRHSRVVNRYLLEKCGSQLRTRLCYNADKSNSGNVAGSSDRTTTRTTKRKELQKKILQDLRLTKEKVEEIIERENIWTIPNFLCMGRIVTSPYLSYLIISHDYKVYNRSIRRRRAQYISPQNCFYLIILSTLSFCKDSIDEDKERLITLPFVL